MAVKLDQGGLSPFYEKIDKLTRTQKIATIGISTLLLVALFIGFSYYPKYTSLKRLKQEHAAQKTRLIQAEKNAAKLELFREKKAKAEKDFKLATKKLPAKEEIPSLLAMISNSGQRVGLEFELFEPKAEQGKGFYVEIPVAIQVTGSYHQTAQFFDRIARLPRVVNIRNITIKPTDKGSDLKTACTAVTYKFIETQAASS